MNDFGWWNKGVANFHEIHDLLTISRIHVCPRYICIPRKKVIQINRFTQCAVILNYNCCKPTSNMYQSPVAGRVSMVIF